MRRVSILLFLFFISAVSFAQTKYFYGRLIDSITLLPVQDVHVIDRNTRQGDITNGRGLFVLEGNLGDTLSFIKVGYRPQNFVLKGNEAAMDTLVITVFPEVHELRAVTVSAYSYKDYQQDSTERRQNFSEAIGYAHHLFESSNSGAGIGFSLDRIFDGKEKRRRRAFRFFQENEEQQYVNFRFNPILLHSLTGLRGKQLGDFIAKYQPSYKWLREHPTNEDILYYVNDKLKQMH